MESASPVKTDLWTQIETRKWGGDSKSAKEQHRVWFTQCNGFNPLFRTFDPRVEGNFVPRTVVDLGCGTGGMALLFAIELGCSVKLFDFEYMKPLLEAYFLEGDEITSMDQVDVTFIPGDLTSHETFAEDGTIDCVNANDVIPYIDPTKLKATLQKVERCLRPGGVFLFSLFMTEALTDEDTIKAEEFGSMKYVTKNPEQFAREFCASVGLELRAGQQTSPNKPHIFNLLAQKPFASKTPDTKPEDAAEVPKPKEAEAAKATEKPSAEEAKPPARPKETPEAATK